MAAPPVVVGVDGSAGSLAALDWATDEALRHDRPLRIVHAFEGPLLHVALEPAPYAPSESGLRHTAEAVLADAKTRVEIGAPRLAVTVDLPVGTPAATLVNASQGAATLVLGSRGQGGISGLRLGSVAATLLAHAHCPVVVVRPFPASISRDRVVVGVDGSDAGESALGYAFAEASLSGLGLTAVHATTDETAGPRESEMMVKALRMWADFYPDVALDARVVLGHPAHVLITEATQAVLVVIGARGRGGFPGLLLGSVSQTVPGYADCPVAVVPTTPP